MLDSNFGDWTNQAFYLDPWNDHSGHEEQDLAAMYWANNPNQQINFYVVQRQTSDGQPFNGSNGVNHDGNYALYVDVNNNGSYTDLADRVIRLEYHPGAGDGKVRVRVYKLHQVGDNKLDEISDSDWNDWGDTEGEGGLRFEFAVTWSDLGFQFGQAMRMFLISYTGKIENPDVRDRLPDGNADIQWSPASILGPWLLGGAFALGIFVVWWFRGRHVWGRRPDSVDSLGREKAEGS